MKKIIRKISAIIFLFSLVSGSTYAATVNLSIDGAVDAAVNWGGLSAGNSITADLVLDITDYTGIGLETFDFTGLNTLNITAGTNLFDQSMDLNASVSFFNGDLYDLNFGAIFEVNGSPENFDSNLLNVLADRSVTTGNGNNAVTTDYQLAAHWDASTTLTPVPVPAALWLMGSGLIGLAGVARRKQK